MDMQQISTDQCDAGMDMKQISKEQCDAVLKYLMNLNVPVQGYTEIAKMFFGLKDVKETKENE